MIKEKISIGERRLKKIKRHVMLYRPCMIPTVYLHNTCIIPALYPA
jgi:hypothetical protein